MRCPRAKVRVSAVQMTFLEQRKLHEKARRRQEVTPTAGKRGNLIDL